MKRSDRTDKESLTVQPKTIWCDDKQDEIPARVCAIKHLSALRRRERDEKQGKPSAYDACRCCETGIEQFFLYVQAASADSNERSRSAAETPQGQVETKQPKTETNQAEAETKQANTKPIQEKKTMPKAKCEKSPKSNVYAPGPCPVCGESKNVLRKKGMCARCCAQARKTGPKVEDAQAMSEKAMIANTTTANILGGPPHVFYVSLPESLYQQVASLAEKEFRTIEKQILWEVTKSVHMALAGYVPA